MEVASAAPVSLLNINTADTSLIISLLDMLGDSGKRHRDSFCEIEARFFAKCHTSISAALQRIEMLLQDDNGAITITKRETPHVGRSPSELSELMLSLEKHILHTGAYDYIAMVDAIMRGAIAYFSVMEPELAESFKQVIWEPNVVSGESFLCHFETGFGTGGLQISYPNPNWFTDAHFASYNPFTGHRRKYRDWAFRLLFWLPHEALHAYDNLHRVVLGTNSEGLWQAEYLPTSMQLNLTAEIARKHGNEVAAQLHDGWFEELLLWALNITRHWEQRPDIMKPDTLEKYQQWRVNSKIPPHEMEPAHVDETAPSLYDYILSRLALESFDMANPDKKLKAFETKIKEAHVTNNEGLIEWPPADSVAVVGPAVELDELFKPMVCRS